MEALLFFTVILVMVGGFVYLAWMMFAPKSANPPLAHSYRDILGIDEKARKLWVHGRALDSSEVRSIEKNSILETKSNAWGMQFHKHKRCELTVHTNSLDRPIEMVSFGSDVDAMNLWYARIGTFFNLT